MDPGCAAHPLKANAYRGLAPAAKTNVALRAGVTTVRLIQVTLFANYLMPNANPVNADY